MKILMKVLRNRRKTESHGNINRLDRFDFFLSKTTTEDEDEEKLSKRHNCQ